MFDIDNPTLEKYYEPLLNTNIDLYEMTREEKDSVEVRILRLHKNKKKKRNAQKLIEIRRKKLDTLIEETGGTTKIKDLSLQEIMGKKYEGRWVMIELVKKAIDNFFYQNPTAFDEIIQTEQYKKFRKIYRENAQEYLQEYILKKKEIQFFN